MKFANSAAALVAMAGALCTTTAALAEDAAKTSAPSVDSSMRVIVDPETGELRTPTAAELGAQVARQNAAAASARSARAAAAPTASAVLPTERSVQRHANGMLSVKLPRESLSALTATTDAQGRAVVKHAGDPVRATTPVVATEK